MKVILQQDVKGQGKKGQMVEVSDGYARNFLLPRKLAVSATADNINTMKQQEKARKAQEAAEKAEAEALSKKLELKAGDKAFVMINGCGATTMMEMLVLFKDTVEFLKAKGVEVVASMVGEILTVQEAGGFQMNIAKWDEEFIRLWNTPCHTPAYSKE